MAGAPTPPLIPEPFANDATVGNSPGNRTTPIPDTVVDGQKASWSLGFQAITMQPTGAGGKPPLGQDVNGVLNTISAHDFFVQAGQLYSYDTGLSTSMGGYKLGAELISTDGSVIWYNTVDGNTTDPDSGGNFGWVAKYAYGNATLNALTGDTVTLTPAQAAKKVIVLNGALTSNLIVVVPAPGTRQWIIVNNTSGAFVTTVQGTGGTGVVIPQGGFSNPVEVYATPADNNVYPLTPQAALIPVHIDPAPNTLVERDGNAYVFANYFNMAVHSDTTVTPQVIYYGNNSDGFIRPGPLSYVEAAMALSAIGGQVTAGQVPLAAVIQYVANILASAALTGTPTAPTAAVGTSTTQVATCGFANPSQNKTVAKGHVELPGGVILNWGKGTVPNGTGGPIDINIAFDLPYATALVGVWPTTLRSVAANGQATAGSGFYSNPALNGATITVDQSSGGVSTYSYWALGW